MIEYQLITKDKYAPVADFMINNFFIQEPMGLALGLTKAEVERWYLSFLTTMLDYSLPTPVSYIAVDSDEGGKIVGAIISMVLDPSKDPPPSMKTFLDPNIEPLKIQIAQLLEDIEDGVDVHGDLKQPPSAKILACLFLSVSPAYGGKGIAKQLVGHSEGRVGDVEGLTIAMTDTTSAISYKVFSSLGYKLIREVEYLSYRDPQGVYIFKGKEDALGIHTHARVVAKVVDPAPPAAKANGESSSTTNSNCTSSSCVNGNKANDKVNGQKCNGTGTAGKSDQKKIQE